MDGPSTFSAPLGGRACSREARALHFFGQYVEFAEIITHEGFQPFVVQTSMRWTQPKACNPRLWLVGSDAVEIVRDVVQQTPPLPAQALSQFGVNNVSMAKIAVGINNFAGQHYFFMDANQWIVLYSDCVAIDLLMPRNFELAADAGTRNGIIADVEIGANAWEIETSSGQDSVRYTTFHFVEHGTVGIIEVPPYARSLTAFQTSQGAASTTWIATLGTTFELASIPWIPGQRRTEHTDLPSATHIRTDVDPNNDRFFTIHWAIRP
jgi:hypothetical protein